MKIALEKIIEIVTTEVIKELAKKGIEIGVSNFEVNKTVKASKPVEIDMTAYKTPILTEKSLLKIGKEIKEIIIPAKTIITPGASYIIKKNKIKVIYKH